MGDINSKSPGCTVALERTEAEAENITPSTTDELTAVEQKIKTGKFAGPDGIPPEAVKIILTEFLEIMLNTVYNLLMAQEFP